MYRYLLALTMLFITTTTHASDFVGTLDSDIIIGAGPTIRRITPSGEVTWEMRIGGNIHDLDILPNGNILVANGKKVQEITPDKKVVFEFTPEGKDTAYGVQRLENGNTVVGNNHNNTVLEVDSTGKVVFTLQCKHTDKVGSHNNQRVVCKTKDNTYLVAHKKARNIVEYKPDGSIVQEFTIGKGLGFNVIRLDNGNTLCAFVGACVEFDKDGKAVWSMESKDVDGLANVCGIQLLPNNNIVIGTYKGLHKNKQGKVSGKYSMLEVTRDKELVWGCTNPKFGSSIMAVQKVVK